MNENEKQYELAFILKSDDTAPVMKALQSRNFSITQAPLVSKIKLAYPIKNERQAYFGFLNLSGSPAAIEELVADLRLAPEVLRFLIVAPPLVKKLTEIPVAPDRGRGPVREPSYRPARPRDGGPPQILSNEALEKKIEEILQ